MKDLLLLILIFPLLSFILETDNDELIGKWELNQVTLNEDTIFYRGQFEFTLKHNFELNKKWITNHEDSMTVIKKSEEGFQNSMSIKVEFLKDSTFKMTKVRSGGQISPKEFDYGTYNLTNDTLLLTNQSRRNYKMMFLIDIENKRFFQRDGQPNQMIYLEYLKVD